MAVKRLGGALSGPTLEWKTEEQSARWCDGLALPLELSTSWGKAWGSPRTGLG